MGRQRVTALITSLILACSVAGCEDRSRDGEPGEGVIAIVNGRPVTITDVQIRMDSMSEETKKELDNPAMLSAFINNEIRERLWAEAAREAGLDETEVFFKRVEMAENSILVQMYNEWINQELLEPTEGEVNEVYERDKELYASKEVHARHILCSTENKAQEALAAIRGGMSFDEAVTVYSEDTYTKDNAGDLGTLSRTTAIPGFGVAPDFFDTLMGLDSGQLAGPIRTRRGYHVVLILSKSVGQRIPPEALRSQIARRLRKERSERSVSEIQAELWERFDVRVFDETIKRFIGYPVTPEQFVTHIQEATSTGDKIQLCREMVSQFPGNKYAPWVQFMLGFVYSEELHSQVDAEEAFKVLLQRYPDSEWAEPARWMIRNMGKQHPPLRNVDDVKARARGSQGGAR